MSSIGSSRADTQPPQQSGQAGDHGQPSQGPAEVSEARVADLRHSASDFFTAQMEIGEADVQGGRRAAGVREEADRPDGSGHERHGDQLARLSPYGVSRETNDRILFASESEFA